jgi:hypothetical protein
MMGSTALLKADPSFGVEEAQGQRSNDRLGGNNPVTMISARSELETGTDHV